MTINWEGDGGVVRDTAPPNWLGPWIERARQAKGDWVVVKRDHTDDPWAKVFDRKGSAQSYKSVVRSGKLPALANTLDSFDAEIGYDESVQGWIIRIRLNNNKKGA